MGAGLASKKTGVCIVTGAARGIGAAVARAAGKRGYAVCVHYLSSKAGADEIVTAIERDGGQAIAVRANITRDDDVAALFGTVDREIGPVTALVNNAGVSERRPLADVDSKFLRHIFDVNFIGAFLCAKEAASRMALARGGHGGSIVNVSSTATRTGGAQLSAYVVAKAGIEGLTLALSKELGRDGIRVNTVTPGVIATEQQPLDNLEWLARVKASTPLGRLGAPEEVAQAILWLLSDDASYVSGVNIPVAGGRS